MKKYACMVLLLLCVTTGSAMALTIGGGAIDVGSLDSLFTAANVNSGNEIEWLNTVLPDTGTPWVISAQITATSWTQVDGFASAYATYFADSPAYFMIKVGEGHTEFSHWLYFNDSSTLYGVVDVSEWGDGPGDSINIDLVSHIREIGGTAVPEPATMLLFGFGLLGVAGYSRRKFYSLTDLLAVQRGGADVWLCLFYTIHAGRKVGRLENETLLK